MQTIKNDKINKIVNLFIPSELRMDGLVIAGGFSTYLYWLSKKSDESLDRLYRSFVLKSNVKNVIEKSYMVGDVDYWILEDSPAHNYYSKITPENADEELPDLSKSEYKALMLGVQDYMNGTSNFSAVTLSRFALSYTIKNPSLHHNSSYKHQVIRYKVWKDIESVLESFDINLCRTAWYQNQLYVSSETIDNFEKGYMNFNENFKLEKNSVESGISVIRYFKYYKRFELEPTKKDVDSIYNLCHHAVDYIKEYDEKIRTNHPIAQPGGSILIPPALIASIFPSHNHLPVPISDDDGYGKANSTEAKLYSVYFSIVKEISTMFCFSQLEPHKVAFFIGSHPAIQDVVKSYFSLITETK